MRISVSGDLNRILSRFSPAPDAMIEFNISEHGLDIVANSSGWKSLARWCLIMAHLDMDGSSEYDIDEGPVTYEMFVSGQAIMAFYGLANSEKVQDIRFHRSRCIGNEFWKGSHLTGNSPRTSAADVVILEHLKCLAGLSITDARSVLGRQVGCVENEYYFDLAPGADPELGHLLGDRKIWVLLDEAGHIVGVGIPDDEEVASCEKGPGLGSDSSEDEDQADCRW